MSIKTIHGYNIEYSSSSDTLSRLVREWENHSSDTLEHMLREARDSSERKAYIGEEENVVLRYKGDKDYSIEKKDY